MYLSEIAGLAGQLFQRKCSHDVHGRPAALIQASAMLVGGLLVSWVRQCAVHALCAGASPAPPAQPVSNGLCRQPTQISQSESSSAAVLLVAF